MPITTTKNIPTADLPEKEKPAAKPPAKKKEVIPEGHKKVTVYWAGTDEKNQSMNIVVNDCGHYGRREFPPGVEVILPEALIARLESAVEERRTPIPIGSGVYEAHAPLKEARAQLPGYTAKRDKSTGVIWMTRRKPIYAISKN